MTAGNVARVWPDEAAVLDEIIRARSVRAVYQPIVELDSGQVIAWEALARGPVGSVVGVPGPAVWRGGSAGADR